MSADNPLNDVYEKIYMNKKELQTLYEHLRGLDGRVGAVYGEVDNIGQYLKEVGEKHNKMLEACVKLDERVSDMHDKMMLLEHDNRYLRIKITMLEDQLRMIESDCDNRHSIPFTAMPDRKEARKFMGIKY